MDVEKSEWEAYDGEYYGAGVEEENAEAKMELLRRYVAPLPRDSYCNSLVLMERTEDLPHGEFSATVWLPSHSPVHGPFKSEAKTLEKAKYQAASKALDALGTVAQLNQEIMVTAEELGSLPCPQSQPSDFWGIPDLLHASEWPEEVVMIRIEVTPDPDPASSASFAFICAPTQPVAHQRFALHLDLVDGLTAWLEPSVLKLASVLGGSREDVIAFHRLVASDLETDGTLCIVRCLGHLIDWELMSLIVGQERLDEDLPSWLRLLWPRVATIIRLQQIAYQFAPVQPAPNPLLLEAVLSCGCGKSKHAFESLVLRGGSVLKLLFSVALYIENPVEHVGMLRKRLQRALHDNHLAKMLDASGLLAEAIVCDNESWQPRRDGFTPNRAARVLMALVGAWTSEAGGDFHGVAKLWDWLCALASVKDMQGFAAALRFLRCAMPSYKGRTPTYRHFHQDQAGLCMTVWYDDFGEVIYSRAGCGQKPSETRWENDEKGRLIKKVRPVTYDFVQKAWTSPSIKMPLPNKMVWFLCGTCCADLCGSPKSKAFKGDTLTFDILCERLDGTLHVRYQNRGWYKYKRCKSGGLGFESQMYGANCA